MDKWWQLMKPLIPFLNGHCNHSKNYPIPLYAFYFSSKRSYPELQSVFVFPLQTTSLSPPCCNTQNRIFFKVSRKCFLWQQAIAAHIGKVDSSSCCKNHWNQNCYKLLLPIWNLKSFEYFVYYVHPKRLFRFRVLCSLFNRSFPNLSNCPYCWIDIELEKKEIGELEVKGTSFMIVNWNDLLCKAFMSQHI